MRFERISVAHRLLGAVIAFVGVMLLWHGDGGSTALAWGVGLAISGSTLVLARGGNLIDFEARQVIAYLGFVVPLSRERRPFSSLRLVSVEGRRRSQNSIGGLFEFPVELRGEGPDVRLCEQRVYAKARRLARQLAHRMGLGLSDHGVERPPGLADEPLRDRLLRTGAIPGQEQIDPSDPYRNVVVERKPPPPPPGALTAVDDGAAATTLRIPPTRRFSLSAGVALLLGLVAGVPAAAMEERLSLIWLSLWVPLAFLFLGVWLSGSTARWRVIVDSKSLRVEKRSWMFRRRYVFPFDELDDVHTASAAEPRYHNLTNVLTHRKATRFVVVRSDARAIPVGAGRSPEELEWLVARIQHAIARHSTEARARV